MKKKIFAILLSFAMVVTMMPTMAFADIAEEEPILDDFNLKSIRERFNPPEINSSTTELLGGNYTVRGHFTNNHRLEVSGNVTINLQDGCDVTFSHGIHVLNNSILTFRASGPNGNGKLTARGDSGYAGIGGDGKEVNVTVNIDGGNITAYGGIGAPGIGGCGRYINFFSKVNINNGTVTAIGGEEAAGIGGGAFFCGFEVTIRGGKLTATGVRAPAIGRGRHSKEEQGLFKIIPPCHTVVLNGRMIDKYDHETGTVNIDTTKHVLDKTYAKVPLTIDHDNGNVTPGTKAYYQCKCGHYFAKYENSELSDPIRDINAWLQGAGKINGTSVKLTFTSNTQTKTVYGLKGEPLPVNLIPKLKISTGDKLYGWFYKANGYNYNFHQQQPLTHTMDLIALSLTLNEYLQSQDKQIINANTADMYGIYSVYGTVNINHRLNVLDNAVIYLQDNCQLNISGGIRVKPDCSLTILGNGTLKVNGAALFCAGIGGNYNEAGGTVTISGCNVEVNGGRRGAGIGGGEFGSGANVTINDAQVTATGGEFAASIGGGYNGSAGTLKWDEGLTAYNITNNPPTEIEKPITAQKLNGIRKVLIKVKDTEIVYPILVNPDTSADATTDTPAEPEVKKTVVSPASIKGLKSYNNALKVTWKAKKNAAGYVIQYSTNKKFKNAKKIVITNAKAKTKKISKLKDKKKYYLRIRCYNINENGKKVYSKWSAVKSMKTK